MKELSNGSQAASNGEQSNHDALDIAQNTLLMIADKARYGVKLTPEELRFYRDTRVGMNLIGESRAHRKKFGKIFANPDGTQKPLTPDQIAEVARSLKNRVQRLAEPTENVREIIRNRLPKIERSGSVLDVTNHSNLVGRIDTIARKRRELEKSISDVSSARALERAQVTLDQLIDAVHDLLHELRGREGKWSSESDVLKERGGAGAVIQLVDLQEDLLDIRGGFASPVEEHSQEEMRNEARVAKEAALASMRSERNRFGKKAGGSWHGTESQRKTG